MKRCYLEQIRIELSVMIMLAFFGPSQFLISQNRLIFANFLYTSFLKIRMSRAKASFLIKNPSRAEPSLGSGATLITTPRRKKLYKIGKDFPPRSGNGFKYY